MQFVKLLVLTDMLLFVTLPAALAAPAVPEPPKPPLTQAEGGEVLTSPPVGKTTAVQGELKFILQHVQFEHPGMALDDGALTALITPYLQREITPQELQAALNRLTEHARTHGYPAALAYIPEQTAVHGELTLRFAPGHLGKIKVTGDDVLREKVARRTLAAVKPGAIIRSRELERSIRNLKDIPGLEMTASLSPGENRGESDLEINIVPQNRDAYILYSENYGGKAAGRYRYGAQADWRNISHRGDRLNLGGLISNGKQHGYNISYEILTGHSATTVDLSYSHTDYELGSIWSQLGMEGKSDTISLYGRTPLRNQAHSAVHLTYAFNYRKLIDELNGLNFGQRHSYSLSLGVDGRYRMPDNILQYNVSLHSGTLSPDSMLADVFATDGGYKGRYTKATCELTNVQKISGPFDVMLKVAGQKAADNLDSSEHIYLGGARGVRAYPQGEASGDEGIMGTCEFRYHTKVPDLTLSAYYDAGHVREIKSSSSSTALQGWGLGLTYIKENDYFARIDYARRIGWDDTLSHDAQSRQRIWFLAGKIF